MQARLPRSQTEIHGTDVTSVTGEKESVGYRRRRREAANGLVLHLTRLKKEGGHDDEEDSE